MRESNGPARLSIVTPFYNEGAEVSRFLDRLTAVLAAIDLDWNVVCINDGSSDDTITHLIAAHDRDPRIKVLDLSRNFGKEYALTAGLDHTGDDVVVLMDSDLQHPPEMLPAMIGKWREGFEVVYMVRQMRGNVGLLGKLGRRFFYLVFRLASDVRLPPEAGDFRLLDPVVVAAIRRLSERTRFMKGIYHWVGFRQAGLAYDEGVRKEGRSRWGFLRLTALAIDGISRIIRTLINGIDVPGFESLIVSVMFLGGIQLLSLGVLGGYIGRIFNEVKARPLYIVRRRYGWDEPN